MTDKRILKAKGSIESSPKCTCLHRLLTLEGLKPNILLESETDNQMAKTGNQAVQIISDINHIKSLKIIAEAATVAKTGNVVSLQLQTIDGTDLVLPVRSLKVELAEIGQEAIMNLEQLINKTDTSET